MAYRFQSFRRLFRSALALTATAAISACGNSPADARVILFSLPDGSPSAQTDVEPPQVWPWISPAHLEASEDAHPIVTLAPELSQSVPAIPAGAAVNRQTDVSSTWTDNARDAALSLLESPLANVVQAACGEQIGLWTEQAAQLGPALRDQLFLARLLRNSIEAEQLVLIENNRAEETRLAAAPAVGTVVYLPIAPATVRGSLSVDDLATLSRNLLCTAGLDTAGILRSLNTAWIPQTNAAPKIELFDQNREAAASDANAAEKSDAGNGDADQNQDSANNRASQARVPLKVLTRPLIRGAADMLNSAGGSLQSLAANLSQLSDATPSEEERQATRQAAPQPQFDKTTAIPLNPAAQHFFGF